MARTKNRGFKQSFSPSYTVRRWRLGAYIRLSKEDLKKVKEGKDDSNSVKNQHDLLGDFYFKHQDEFESIAEYVDDGYTGTDANRENFQRLLADVMSGKINCVIVKDLSRFARNYSDAGSLIDNLFVQMGVRFISLAENVDSYRDPDSVSSIIVPITNVMNDQYCYQTSKKIRQVFDYKRRNGQYIGSFAPYGYVKDPKDKHLLIVDPEAAEIVKLIYDLCLQGMARRSIVYHLNDHGIPSPATYRKEKGLPVSSPSDTPLWGDKAVTLILTNPIYTGDLVQGRRRVKSYKVHQIEEVPEEEEMKTQEEVTQSKVAISIADVKGNDEIHGQDIADLREVAQEKPKEEVEEIFMAAEQMPQFPGGPAALQEFLAKNLRYPPIAAENGISGTVVVRFAVWKDGSIRNIEVLSPVDRSLDEEAVRVIKSMPNWIPGKQNGNNVSVYFTAPVRFQLAEQ